MKAIISAINKATTREEVHNLISDLSIAQLKEIAKHYHIFLGYSSKEKIKERIVEGTIGVKLRSKAIHKVSLK